MSPKRGDVRSCLQGIGYWTVLIDIYERNCLKEVFQVGKSIVNEKNCLIQKLPYLY